MSSFEKPQFVCSTKTGIKKKLSASAAYPRAFGDAVASILPPRGSRPVDVKCEDINVNYPVSDDLGALDDLLKGRAKTWWRNI